MEHNTWTDFFLPQDMGLDLLDDQYGGQYGDLKERSRLDGDWKPLVQPEDVVQQLSAYQSPDQTCLDSDWMESDISSFLDVLALQQQGTFAPVLLDSTSSLQLNSTDESNLNVLNDFLDTNDNLYSPINQDCSLTPPDSPDKVNPVIKFESRDDSYPADNSHFGVPTNDIILNGISLSETFETERFEEPIDFLNSPLSAADIENTLSISQPVSPQSLSANSVILSSPELYKVIVAPSNFSNRSSDVSDLKSKKKAKARKVKSEIVEIPEDLAKLNKKDRKRLQNKVAAIRYRQKKKVEAKDIDSEVDGLETQNKELKTKVEDLEREIRYMKNLMHDIQKAKGLL